MSITIGSRLAPTDVQRPQLELLAQASGPVGPSKRLPPDAVNVLRQIFGPQVDRLPSRLVVWNASLQQATKDRTVNGTIFYDPSTKLWHAAVSQPTLEREAKKFSDPPRFKGAIEVQEVLHALAAHNLSTEKNNVVGEYGSMLYYPDYAFYTMQHTLSYVQGRPAKGYGHIYHYSLHALGSVAAAYEYPFSGSMTEKGRQLMQEFIRSGASNANKLTPGFLLKYARDALHLENPQQFVNDLRNAFVDTFRLATLQTIGEPGKFRVR